MYVWMVVGWRVGVCWVNWLGFDSSVFSWGGWGGWGGEGQDVCLGDWVGKRRSGDGAWFVCGASRARTQYIHPTTHTRHPSIHPPIPSKHPQKSHLDAAAGGLDGRVELGLEEGVHVHGLVCGGGGKRGVGRLVLESSQDSWGKGGWGGRLLLTWVSRHPHT